MRSKLRVTVRQNSSRIVLGLVSALVLGQIICFALLIPALGKIRDQAGAGDRARDRQASVAPTACKIAQDSYRRGVITRGELETYADRALSPCPVPALP